MARAGAAKYGFRVNLSSLSRFAAASFAIAFAVFGAACSSSSSGTDTGDGGSSGSSDGGTVRPPPIRPMASCPVLIEYPELLPATHVTVGTPITYNSNPPSSGPHYGGAWANFQEFDKPLDEGYLVHSLEHGAVALLYKCAGPSDAACAANLATLRTIRDSIAADPSGSAAVRVRMIIAPSPRLDKPVAAAAWGVTYKGDCVDVPTLTQFVKDNYAKGPEDVCAPGSVF